ncbi:lipopolysaccharide transport periplasmic protein LptA [Arenicella sp. 4NH20-0111]|uniref:lipopolysaccharide transport periplasmic protein LptA n=1 Tax=Arenicella sp. 4NH20-0111 TaxID=3127648 RepID=UPI00333FDF4B
MKSLKNRLFSSRPNRFLGLMASVMALLISSSALALKSDRDQPADIEAEDTLFDFKTGKRTFTGNVIVIQGTLRIKADKVVANYKDGELQNATAWGKPARFKQRPDGKPDDVEGRARKIYVNSLANTLLLTTRANLTQGGTSVNGESILYNMANDTLKVQGSDNKPSSIGTGGKSGKARPQRKLEDPFKDDPLPSTKKTKKKKSKKSTQSKKGMTDAEDAVEATVEDTAPPVPVGRSRLIIQPKPKPKPEVDSKKKNKDDDAEETTNEDDSK